jgi:pimeloyl-ACP methyl ester carboxylesterase
VQNALASLAGDVETTKRVIEAQTGPVVVVGHSYGGAVITGAAAANPNVKALVYVAAFAAEAGEPIAALLDKYPSDLGTAGVKDAAGYLSIDVAKFHDVFAADLPRRETDVMAVTQKPINGAIFGQWVPAVAWKTIPSWYLVTQRDHAINPELERFYARRIKAHTTEIDLAIAQLEAAGITAVSDSNDTVGIFGPGFQGATAHGVTVRVPQGSIDEARAVLSIDRETER